MLNAINQEKIETMFRAFTGKEQVNINPLISQWLKNKKDIFELFNDSLTIERKFSGSLSDDYIRQLFRSFISENDHYTSCSFDDLLRDLTVEEFKSNKCLKDRSNMRNYIKNQKLSKYLTSLIDDIPDYTQINGKTKTLREYFSIKFSMFLQQLKFEGILVMSIDPLDYLTMSLNKSDWRSCHRPSGEYRTGMLSYMTDSCSVIAYVKSENDVEYDFNDIKFMHNTKKWRQVVYIDINTLSAIFSRQYPSDNENAAKVARELMGNQFSNFVGIGDKYTITKNRNRIFAMMEDINNPFHYNDILNNIEREYVRLKMVEGGSNPNIIVGNIPVCPVCGDKNLDTSDELLCKKCRGAFHICADCGKILYHGEDESHYHNRNNYCNSCWEQNFVRCKECGDWERISNGVMLNENFVCNSCLGRYYIKCEDCGIYVKSHNKLDYDGYSYCVTCYDKIDIEEEMSA